MYKLFYICGKLIALSDCKGLGNPYMEDALGEGNFQQALLAHTHMSQKNKWYIQMDTYSPPEDLLGSCKLAYGPPKRT